MNDNHNPERRQMLRLFAVTGATVSVAALSAPARAAQCEHDGTPLQFTPKTQPDPKPLENELGKYPKCPYCGMEDVYKRQVEIAVPEPISVPEEALSNPPKQFEHFSEEQKKSADGVCNQHSELAEKAFQYWLEMIRWASGAALIGQPSISGFESGWSTYLMESATNHRVWASPIMLTVYREYEVTKEHWEIAAEHLRNSDELPMHLRFFHDAVTSTRHGQYKKAIIEIAMACEIYLRYAVFEFIPERTPEELRCV